MQVVRKVVDALASFKLSVAILFFMFLITWLGTLSQESIGLFQSQRRYFESWVVLQKVVGWLHVPLPGGVLLMVALAVNLLFGGIVRLRRTWSRVGILITHVGIALLLLAGAVKFGFSNEGSLALYEGERSGEYVSYHDWEIAVQELLGDGEVRQWLVPQGVFEDRTGDKVAEVGGPALPFRMEIFGFARNARVLPKGPMFDTPQPVVDGYFVRPLTPDKEAERDLAACYVRVYPAGGGAPIQGILWGGTRHPLTVRTVDREFGIKLRRKRYPLPFEVELTKFTHEYHPGTGIARVYKSDVLVHEGGRPEPMLIEMNSPLRRQGFIAFQSSWGPQNARPGDRLFSVFAVVQNPSDQWPLWACVVIGIGLSIHFLMMLARYIRSEVKVAR